MSNEIQLNASGKEQLCSVPEESAQPIIVSNERNVWWLENYLKYCLCLDYTQYKTLTAPFFSIANLTYGTVQICIFFLLHHFT